jgi:hypothetical protein
MPLLLVALDGGPEIPAGCEPIVVGPLHPSPDMSHPPYAEARHRWVLPTLQPADPPPGTDTKRVYEKPPGAAGRGLPEHRCAEAACAESRIDPRYGFFVIRNFFFDIPLIDC